MSQMMPTARVVLRGTMLGGGGATGYLTDTDGVFRPEQFNPAEDPEDLSEFYYPNEASSIALKEALLAAVDNGGRVELVSGKIYSGSGDNLQGTGVAVLGASHAAFGSINSKVMAIDETFRWRWGDQTGPGANPYPGAIQNVVIDGANLSTAPELFRVEAIDSSLDTVVVCNGLADGMVLHNAQNNNLTNPIVANFPNGDCYKVQNNDDLATNGQAGGHNIVFGGHITSGNRLLHMTYDVTDPEGVLNFWPHDNMFFGTIFEQYQADVDCLAKISDGETRFIGCTFTGSSGMETCVEDCVFLIENEIRPTLPTTTTFDHCDFGGGAFGVTDLIRSVSFGLANTVRFFGRTNGANLGVGWLLCDDRGPEGGLGLDAQIFGAIDGLGVNEEAGVQLSRGVTANGGIAGTIVATMRGGFRFLMDSVTARPLQFRRLGRSFNQGTVDRDMGLRWQNGLDGGVRGALLPVFDDPATGSPADETYTDTMYAQGRWTFGDGFVRSKTSSLLNADAAVTIDTQLTSYHLISFLASGVDVTALTISNAVEDAMLTLVIVGTGVNTITWPAGGDAINWVGDAPQPENGVVKFVHLVFLNGDWYETTPASGGSSGGGSGGTYDPVEADVTGTYDLDLADGSDFYLTATGDTAITYTPVDGDVFSVTLIQDGTGGWDWDLPGTWKGVAAVEAAVNADQAAGRYHQLGLVADVIGVHVQLASSGSV